MDLHVGYFEETDARIFVIFLSMALLGAGVSHDPGQGALTSAATLSDETDPTRSCDTSVPSQRHSDA